MTTHTPIHDRNIISQLVKVNSALPLEIQETVLDIIARSGVVWEGHFSFPDCHSQHLLNFRSIGIWMEKECEYLASLLVNMASINLAAEVPLRVLSSELSGGMFFGRAVAKMFVSGEESPFNKMALTHAEFAGRKPLVNGKMFTGKIDPGDRVVVVNDIDRTGESISRFVKVPPLHLATVEAVLVFAVCNSVEYVQRMATMGLKSYYLVEVDLRTVEKGDCPRCCNGELPYPVSVIV